MSKLVYSMMVSLDGFVEDSDGSLNWVAIDEEIHRFANDEAREMSTFIYGRRMYELMSRDWPKIAADPSIPEYMADFARIWGEKPKVVFSTTLEKVGWNSRLVKDNIVEEITKLKEQPGGEMGVSGPNLAATFIRLGLIDEYRLLVNPIVLGSGKPFFPALDSPLTLRLMETRTFRSGVVFLRYQKAGDGL